MKTMTKEQQKLHEEYGFEYYFEPETGKMEFSQVRTNMMKDVGYSPYCMTSGCYRYSNTDFIGVLKCSKCGDIITFPKEFMDRYRAKHGM